MLHNRKLQINYIPALEGVTVAISNPVVELMILSPVNFISKETSEEGCIGKQ